MSIHKQNIATTAVHGGQEPDPITGAISTNIVVAKNGAFRGIGNPIKLEYSRSYHPTREVLEKLISELEGGGETIAFASGIAAVHCFFATFKKGDHIIFGNKLYGGSIRLADLVLSKYLEFDYVDLNDLVALKAAIRPETKYIFVETPTNPLLDIIDLEALQQFSVEVNIPYAIDATFATPYLLRAFEYGAETIIHSTSKYLGGHDDLLGGTITTNNPRFADSVRLYIKTLGPIPSPFDVYNTIRGIKTLALRMEKHCDNTEQIVEYLVNHSQIENVLYPGLESHPCHKIAARQMKRFGGVVSFEVRGDYKAFAQAIASQVPHIIYLAESLGGVESLINHPSSMSHSYLGEEGRAKAGIKDNLFRLSPGIEHVDDIIESLRLALLVA